MIVVGATLLFGSLFLTWSHQFSPALPAMLGRAALAGVPADATAWQVYGAADVLLTVLALGLIAAAALGSRRGRQVACIAAAVALGFTLHALAVPPTNGVLFSRPSLNVGGYVPTGAGAGPGETVAIIGLAVALAGLVVSFLADRPASEPV